MNKIKQCILTRVYGEKIIEAFALDMMLSGLKDGLPRPYAVLTAPNDNISVWDLSRKADKLLADGMIKISGDNVLITSNGVMQLDKGGYVDEIKRHRRSLFSFWLSIFAVLVSLTSIILTWLNSRVS